MADPKPSADPLYQLLRDDEVVAFNKQREPGRTYDFRGCTFRGSDLRGLDARGLDLRDCYFRDADLRGVDLRQAQLEGASLGSAKISGAFFAGELAPEEIRLSIEFGTRLRVTSRTSG
ncbi:MAG: pentapeptide repeat-containing protein [Polyangiaceae bacterium]